jgi:putative transport protein
MDLLARQGITGIGASLLVVAMVVAAGIGVGHLRVRGIGLGVAGVLFAGLVAGHFGFLPPSATLELLRDFGLILFVYAIGAQLGPGFFESLRHGGVRLNALAAAVAVGGVVVAAAGAVVLDLDPAGVVGVLAGATTNTPSLGAAQQVLDGMAGVDDARRGLPSLGYAVAYPFGVAGIIAGLVVLRAIFKVDARAEADALLRARVSEHPAVERRTVLVQNENLNGCAIKDVPGFDGYGVVVSRVLPRHGTAAVTARSDTVLHAGDALLVVGAGRGLNDFAVVVGRTADVDLRGAPGAVDFRRVVMTNKAHVGRTLADAEVALGGAVTFTRLRRGEVELTARGDHRLRLGDIVQAVGETAALDRAALWFGNSDKALSTAELLPMFIGIAVGLVVGAVAIPLGLPAPLKLGLAGGPLLTAIVLGRVGRVGPIVWYMPGNVNAALRELGMALFLSAVGLKAGAHVVEAARSGAGPLWVGLGLVITVVPLVVVGAFARVVFKLDYPTLSGVLAGAMTDPPALAFAQGLAGSDAPAVGYAAVYPLTMVLRIVTAQLLVLFLS